MWKIVLKTRLPYGDSRIFALSPASRLCAGLGWLHPGPVLLKMKLSLWVTANQTISQILDCVCKISFQSLVILLSLHSIYFHWCRRHFRWFSVTRPAVHHGNRAILDFLFQFIFYFCSQWMYFWMLSYFESYVLRINPLSALSMSNLWVTFSP